MARRYLVTGGAGYVGSHLVLALRDRGDEVVVYDNLRLGHRAAVPPGVRLIEADLADTARLRAVLAEGGFEAVFHFAARSLVGESMRDPFGYLAENAGYGLRLIELCAGLGVPRFVLSSTANVYGTPARVPIAETEPLDPSSPYGESKLMLERMLHWADRVFGLRHAVLRYFNAAGSDPDGRAGEAHRPETHLIPLAIDAALGRSGPLHIFGTDYPTPDGTCIRDYVHVSDLAAAHLLALQRLDHGSVIYNVGTGAGHSVLEVVRAVERVGGRPVPVQLGPRRPGDPPVLVAAAARLRRETGWSPRLGALDDIVRTALDWRAAHPDGYPA